jgi:hypothetical protein
VAQVEDLMHRRAVSLHATVVTVQAPSANLQIAIAHIEAIVRAMRVCDRPFCSREVREVPDALG